jgi:NitT/TauT family transport system ATP-binding protein
MIVSAEKIYKRYGNVKVLENISLKIKKKEIVCILGASGCGKSTLLNIIAGLIDPSEGEIESYANRIGYVFQEDRLLPWKTVYENIKIVETKTDDKKIYKLIADIGLEGFENSYPNELSGGMRQRCSIARTFNYQSELLLMDEPFKSLDYSLRAKLMRQLINVWEKTSNSIIFVTHEIDEALILGDRIIVLSSRPSKIIKIFEIETYQNERKLNSNNLTKIRNEIINLLVEPSNAKKGA